MQKLLSFKQPPVLYLLSLAYMGERFGYFMLRSILVLYMIKILLLSADHSYGIFSIFTALLYLAPLIGGPLADQYIGNKQAVMLGGLLLSAGLIILGLDNNYLYTALGFIICGKGLYAPSIITNIGNLYHEEDSRREGGFSMVYTAINVSAIIASLISGSIIYYFGWKTAFILAGLTTLLGIFLFYIVNGNKSFLSEIHFTKYAIIFINILFGICLFNFCLRHKEVFHIILVAMSSILIFYGIKKSYSYSSDVRKKLVLCFALTAFSIIFFILSQQSVMALTLFSEYNVDRNIWILQIPTYSLLALNPFFIITIAPLLSMLWNKLAINNINPSVPIKFALGTIFLGLGFMVLVNAIYFAQSHTGKIDIGWIVISYFLQSLGELLIYPIGLAMITEFAPKDNAGFMIGVWYCATAVGTYLAGWFSQLTVLPSGITDPLKTSIIYAHVFGLLGGVAIIAGVLLIFCIYCKSVVNFKSNRKILSQI